MLKLDPSLTSVIPWWGSRRLVILFYLFTYCPTFRVVTVLLAGLHS